MTVGGGTGSFEVLSALRKEKEKGTNIEISTVVFISDYKRSIGVLMDDYGILLPGRC